MGRATVVVLIIYGFIKISIHALRGEGDCAYYLTKAITSIISIHALRGEGDVNDFTITDITTISIHALRGEGDVSRYDLNYIIIPISIHALRGEGDLPKGGVQK